MWARNGRWILPEMPDFHVAFRNLLHAVNLRHGTDGFTFPPKEGVLRIFSPWKIWRLRPGLNPRTWVPKASTLPLDHRSRLRACHKIQALLHALFDGRLFLEQTERQFHVTRSRHLVVLRFIYYNLRTYQTVSSTPARTSRSTHFQLEICFFGLRAYLTIYSITTMATAMWLTHSLI